MISVCGLGLAFGKEMIFQDINIEVNKGEIWGIIGRNGSGKTMLMKCICGFVRPTVGSIVIDGKQVGKDIDYPSDVGMMIEEPGFLPY